MATPTELAELERGGGAWENIQEVLRFGVRSLWQFLAGVDDRVTELEMAAATQKNDSQRQQRHLEAIAQTLNAMSEQLRLEQEEATNQQVETRLQLLECQLQDQLVKGRTATVDDDALAKSCVAKVERRLELLEEEMGHVVTAIGQKADAEAMLAQGRSLEEAMRKRCKKEAFNQEMLALQKRLHQQRQELEQELSTSLSDFRAAQDTIFQSEMENWAAKTQERACHSVQAILDQEIQKQGDSLGAMNIQMKLCCEALEAQQKRLDGFQVEIEKQVRLTIAADREEIARQCSDAHGRIDYQFRTQEESLERVRVEQRGLREEITRSVSQRAQQTIEDTVAAVEDLDRRVLDREHQELEKMHHQLTEEVQLTIASALKALEPAKDKEQRKSKQHQHVVGRKLAELDQMMQLMGRQLIQNTSQLQVVRNEQLVHNFQLDLQSEDAGYSDDELLLQHDNIAEGTTLAEVSQTPVLPAPQTEARHSTEMTRIVHEDTSELLARRSQHQELQEQLDNKLRDYIQVLNSNQRRATEEGGHLTQPTQSPKE
ncbi:hypothetical protein PHYPSEUDO_000557 [Phytophthora pseudosyringae]|uniref:Uncharacterized protein n=1 Tax=Phytophthora pseudosyringae TaxID=221518 RepID=A0A8T1VZ68_9STRA|nr:hypothetical protein PHYPSEUDO_000557 [Phytophthora pseudosyringae]